MGYRGWNAGKGWVTEWQTTATIGRSLKTEESSINQAAAIEGYLQTLRFYLFFLPRAERNYFLPSSSARYLEFLRVRRADQLVIQEQLIFAGSPWVSSDWLFLMKMLFADEVWKFFSRSIPFLMVNEDLNLIENTWRGFSMWKGTWTPAQHATTIMWKSCLFVKWESMRTKPSSERERKKEKVFVLSHRFGHEMKAPPPRLHIKGKESHKVSTPYQAEGRCCAAICVGTPAKHE